MEIDFSKGSAIHRLYGHQALVVEAEKQKKDRRLIRAICRHVKCNGDKITWRNRL